MVMSYDQYIRTIMRLEYQAKNTPKRYKAKVLLLGLFGYFYIILVLLAAIGILYGMGLAIMALLGTSIVVSLKLIGLLFPVGMFILFVLRSLWVTIPEPGGLELRREQAVTLFHTIKAFSRKLRVPIFDKVIINQEFNAGVVQIPRLGILGWQKNYLMIGLPLMMCLSPDEFQAVLAHELGHISKAHSRFEGWVYRLEKTWVQIFQTFQENRHGGSIVFELFFYKYSPFFSAYTFALRKASEYEADKCAAELVNARFMADGLTRMDMILLKINKHSDNKESAEKVDAASLLKEAIQKKGDYLDSHPALSLRLRALKQQPRVPEPFQESAADRFLGKSVVALAEALQY
jgi:Zn-dependent protease with chaperone function